MPTIHSFASRLARGTAAAALTGAMLLSGCTGSSNSGGSAPPAATTAENHDHDHAHATEGPHHGDLVELGNEEYHAEIVHGDSGEVTVYVLDSGAAKAVSIEATEVTINLSHKGEAEQFKLLTAPDSGDPEGKSSRFTLKDEHLAEDLDAKGAVAKLVITINGKQYTGKIEHDHDHEGHDHEHKDHKAE